MYVYFLGLCVALVIFSPLVFELVLTIAHDRLEGRRTTQPVKQKSPGMAWATLR